MKLRFSTTDLGSSPADLGSSSKKLRFSSGTSNRRWRDSNLRWLSFDLYQLQENGEENGGGGFQGAAFTCEFCVKEMVFVLSCMDEYKKMKKERDVFY
ncbi:hypothetical protein TorRG33x02_151140 [Trema orientale]|uniref:Uncharacterized protein n=1 Tax=Trema orientale TaxID=63057 RepID=A0A2P5EU19_TREOI|nr:hypothetical protein TorRG33x02_151140 [Trema orientale]